MVMRGRGRGVEYEARDRGQRQKGDHETKAVIDRCEQRAGITSEAETDRADRSEVAGLEPADHSSQIVYRLPQSLDRESGIGGDARRRKGGSSWPVKGHRHQGGVEVVL